MFKIKIEIIIVLFLFNVTKISYAEECPLIWIVKEAIKNHESKILGYKIHYIELLRDINSFQGAELFSGDNSVSCYYYHSAKQGNIRLYKQYETSITTSSKNWKVCIGAGFYQCGPIYYGCSSERVNVNNCQWTI